MKIMNKIRERSRSPIRYNVYIASLPLSFPQPRLFSMFSKFGCVVNIKMNLPDAMITFKTKSSAAEATILYIKLIIFFHHFVIIL